MNEFQWLQQTRGLERDIEPARDLWPAIAASLGARRAARPAWAIAAGIVLAVATTLGLVAGQRGPVTATNASAWQPNDPRLAAAALDLDAADAELAGALRQAPDAAFLQQLMHRTDRQRARLRRHDRPAG